MTCCSEYADAMSASKGGGDGMTCKGDDRRCYSPSLITPLVEQSFQTTTITMTIAES
jgi:hypothetical protein